MLGYLYLNLHKYSSSSDRESSSLDNVHLKSLIVEQLGTSVVNLSAHRANISVDFFFFFFFFKSVKSINL